MYRSVVHFRPTAYLGSRPVKIVVADALERVGNFFSCMLSNRYSDVSVLLEASPDRSLDTQSEGACTGTVHSAAQTFNSLNRFKIHCLAIHDQSSVLCMCVRVLMIGKKVSWQA